MTKRRRTQNDVVNATLLEIFILLVFILMIVAVVTMGKLDRFKTDWNAKAKFICERAGLPCTDHIASLERQVAALRVKERELAELKKKDVAEGTLRPTSEGDKKKEPLKSNIPPTCDKGRMVMEITLHAIDRIEVLTKEDIPGHKRGSAGVISLSNLGEQYKEVIDDAHLRDCWYLVRVRDTESISKQDYKLALDTIKRIFRTSGELR